MDSDYGRIDSHLFGYISLDIFTEFPYNDKFCLDQFYFDSFHDLDPFYFDSFHWINLNESILLDPMDPLDNFFKNKVMDPILLVHY